MIEVQLKAIGSQGSALVTTYGTSTTLAGAKAEAWRGMAARLSADPLLERNMRDLKMTVL